MLLAYETIYAKEGFSMKVGNQLVNLASMSARCKRLAEARAYADRAIKVLKVCYGPKHPLVTEQLVNLKQQISMYEKFRTRRR